MENLNVKPNYKFAIVCDSGCDFENEFYGLYDVKLVPFHVRLGSDDLLDVQEAVPEDFYVRFTTQKERVTTSHPSPAEFSDAYQELIDAGYTDILSIHISSELSASYSSATTAASEFEDVRIEVFDTKTASAAEGFVVAEAVSMRDEGYEIDDVLAHISMVADKSKLYFIPTQKNALGPKKVYEKGLRSKIKKAMDSAFGTRFLDTINQDGRVESVTAASDSSSVAGRLARIMSKDAHMQGRIYYVEASCGAPRALDVIEKPLNTNEFESVYSGVINVGPALASHVGVGCVGIAYIPEESLFSKDFTGKKAWEQFN